MLSLIHTTVVGWGFKLIMHIKNRIPKKVLVIIGVLLIFIILLIVFLYNSIFRIMSVSPSDKSIYGDQIITIKLNKQIKNKDDIKNNTKVTGGRYGITIDDNKMSFIPLEGLTESVNIYIPNIDSVDNKNILGTKLNFAIKKRDFGLSDKEAIEASHKLKSETALYYKNKYPWMIDIANLNTNYVTFSPSPYPDFVYVKIDFSPLNDRRIIDDDPVSVEKNLVRADFERFLNLTKDKGVQDLISIDINDARYQSYVLDLIPSSMLDPGD
jgi:hypothetical protein